MKLYTKEKSFTLYHGSMLDMLDVIEPNSIDSIITDPPYELGFMNKGWDSSGIAFQRETWEKCFAVLKSGGYLLAFGGSRTFHRIACAIEDAGFEIRDTIMWLYGSGFPKSMNIGKAIEEKVTADKAQKWSGWGTALKPAYEPIIVARKPCESSCTDNVIKYGVGGINIDECRISTTDTWHRKEKETNTATGYQRKNKSMFAQKSNGEMNENGRFPANVILTYDETDFDEVCGGMPFTKGNANARHNNNDGKQYTCFNNYGNNVSHGFNDEGNASRYFYCAKASKKDRDEGLQKMNAIKVNDGRKKPIDNAFQRGESLRKNTHPTVKPTALMQYLVRLVSPKGATILDVFNGSGSTGKAVMYENKERNAEYKYIGIELTEEYLPIADARIRHICEKKINNKDEPDTSDGQMSIFDVMNKNEEV